jgi:hypothetical protein
VYALVVTAVLALAPPAAVLTDTAEIVELNHFFDADGRLVFDQIIFWEWRDDLAGLHVFAWRLCKSSAQIPLRDWPRGGYSATWFDGDRFRQVRARSFRETWTQYDPEVADHQFVPPDQRRGLVGEKPLIRPLPVISH